MSASSAFPHNSEATLTFVKNDICVNLSFPSSCVPGSGLEWSFHKHYQVDCWQVQYAQNNWRQHTPFALLFCGAGKGTKFPKDPISTEINSSTLTSALIYWKRTMFDLLKKVDVSGPKDLSHSLSLLSRKVLATKTWSFFNKSVQRLLELLEYEGRGKLFSLYIFQPGAPIEF